MSSRSLAFALLLVIGAHAVPAGAGQGEAPRSRVGQGLDGGLSRDRSIVTIPLVAFGALFRAIPGLGGRSPELEDGRLITREQGWRVVGFSVNEAVRGLYLEVAGKLEFDRAEVVYQDGALEPIDLKGAERHDGLFELSSLASPRAILGVRLRARARSSQAQVALRLAR